MANQKKIKGIITEYNFERGFGFITEIKKDVSYFFHISNIDKNMQIVPNKTEVLFDTYETSKGLQATNIKPYSPKIEGEFANIDLPNVKLYKTNTERLQFLLEQESFIFEALETLKKIGINVTEERGGWITLDVNEMKKLKNPKVDNGYSKVVPNGYPKTFEHLIGLLQKQINDFNFDLNNTKKGLRGEEKTLNSLKAITLSYPVLNNIRLEENLEYTDTDNEKFSAETDLIIITDRAIFLIEIKNQGGKGDTIIITNDGRWLLKDKYTQKEKAFSNNPFKQSSDHQFLITKFIKDNNFETETHILYEKFKSAIIMDPTFKIQCSDSNNSWFWDDLFGTEQNYIKELRRK